MAYRVVTIGGIGDAASDAAAAQAQQVSAGIDPAKKAQFLQIAATMPDDRASDLAEIVDATPYGGRLKWVRYGIGAAIGAAAGVFILTPIVGWLVKDIYRGAAYTRPKARRAR